MVSYLARYQLGREWMLTRWSLAEIAVWHSMNLLTWQIGLCIEIDDCGVWREDQLEDLEALMSEVEKEGTLQVLETTAERLI